MELNIHGGQRVAYKYQNSWTTGELRTGQAALTDKGLYLYIIPKEFIGKDQVPYCHDAEINDIFLDAFPVEEWMKDCKDMFFTKQEYINHIEEEDFVRALENAYVSDGEYCYYPVGKYTRNWIEKQPFDYIVTFGR